MEMIIGRFHRPAQLIERVGASAGVTTTRAGKCRMSVGTAPFVPSPGRSKKGRDSHPALLAFPPEPTYLESGSGRTWNFTSFGVFPLPPSMWNGARVEIGV